jgi:hypothetical protein
MCVNAPTIDRGTHQPTNYCTVMAKRNFLFLFWVDALLHNNQQARDLRTEQIQIQKGQLSKKYIDTYLAS